MTTTTTNPSAADRAESVRNVAERLALQIKPNWPPIAIADAIEAAINEMLPSDPVAELRAVLSRIERSHTRSGALPDEIRDCLAKWSPK